MSCDNGLHSFLMMALRWLVRLVLMSSLLCLLDAGSNLVVANYDFGLSA